MDETIFDKIPTIAKMRALFDNYEMDASVNEQTTPTEEKEIKEFIDALLDTEVMKIAMNFMQKKGQSLIVVSLSR